MTRVTDSESDTNRTERRAAWQRNLDAATRALVEEDARYFLRQSVSTPCLSAVVRAEGIWIEDAGGRAVWELTYRMTEATGGAAKNRRFRGFVELSAGEYVAHYVTDDSHSFSDFNDAPPHDPAAWGIRLSLAPR